MLPGHSQEAVGMVMSMAAFLQVLLSINPTYTDNVPVYHYEDLSVYRYIITKTYQCTGISLWRLINVPVYHYEDLSVYRYIIMKTYQCTGISL